MLSGVGPKGHLAEHGIPLVHDLPGVGQSLQDHITIHTRFRVKHGHSSQWLVTPTSILDKVRTASSLARWLVHGSGPFTSNVCYLILHRSETTNPFDISWPKVLHSPGQMI
jgi:choline dehydrogenase